MSLPCSILFVTLLLLASCSSTPKRDYNKGEYWLCHAVSEHGEKNKHGPSHWAICAGDQWCARQEALKKCLWFHPRDCVITNCTPVPERAGPSNDKALQAPLTDEEKRLEALPNN